jgi:hypothetical protein
MITSLLTWCFTIYGISNVGVYGKILNNFRDTIENWGNNKKFPLHGFFYFLREMMRCMMCLPMWIGFLFGFFLYSPLHSILGIDSSISWFFDGCLASGTTWMINSIIEWFETNSNSN